VDGTRLRSKCLSFLPGTKSDRKYTQLQMEPSRHSHPSIVQQDEHRWVVTRKKEKDTTRMGLMNFDGKNLVTDVDIILTSPNIIIMGSHSDSKLIVSPSPRVWETPNNFSDTRISVQVEIKELIWPSVLNSLTRVTTRCRGDQPKHQDQLMMTNRFVGYVATSLLMPTHTSSLAAFDSTRRIIS
jgi:hypothetical protein